MRWNFIVKEVNAILLRHSWTNLFRLFQHWMQKNPKLDKTELTSLLTATTLKMNSKYCKPSP